ncbi:helix-turn-helix domain-containing protein [Vibrio cholerae]
MNTALRAQLFEISDLKHRIPRATLHRYLTALVDAGWVEACGSKQNMVWKPSNHFIKLAFTYRNAVRAEVDRIGAEFRELTGEDL